MFFALPRQSDVAEVLWAAYRIVVFGNNIIIMKAIPPPHGTPVRNAGTR